ncbi:MAG: Hpt domain-containing protein [Planctomycetia bacterium]|nr:Hpt domain-containing protein [Planctomycetia bacterium]
MTATEVFDYPGTLERLGGDAGLFADLVRFFLEDAGEILQRAHDAAQEKDAVKLSRAAHSLKGLCSNFGGRQAVDLAWRIEQRAMAAEIDTASLAELDTAIERLSTALRRQLEAGA